MRDLMSNQVIESFIVKLLLSTTAVGIAALGDLLDILRGKLHGLAILNRFEILQTETLEEGSVFHSINPFSTLRKAL